jgi:hypothetical protein
MAELFFGGSAAAARKARDGRSRVETST